MASGIFGYFKFTMKDNLLDGVYMNQTTPALEPETGQKIAGDPNTFIGTYETQWTDIALRNAVLRIDVQNVDTFSLTWNLQNPPVRFLGRGIVNAHNELVGFYEMLP